MRMMGARTIAVFGLTVALLGGCRNEPLNRIETPPAVVISAPDHGSVINTLSVTFEGIVADDQDLVTELALVWESNLLDDPLNTDPADTSGYSAFTAAALPPGDHVITLTVTDTDGLVASESIEIQVLPPAPTIDIIQPSAGSQYQEDETVPFEATITAGSGTGELSYAWFSRVGSVDSLLAAGDVDSGGTTSFTDLLTPGLHTIRVEAEDEYGNFAAEDVLIQITAIPVGPLDQDGDGWCPEGQDVDGSGECEEGEPTNDGDCNDGDATVYPGAPEICDGKDNDCDFVLPPDENDGDGDGYAPCQGDCDDLEADAHPNHPEWCDGFDNNCDGLIDENDQDVDGDGVTGCNGDCNDNNANIRPGAPEICDNLDNNCDGNIDEHDVDLDGDGYSVCDGDCDDANQVAYPGAFEACDGVDNDCDNQVDENDVDADNDGWTTCAGDCNDGNGAMFPGNPEICDIIDNNCNGQIDELDVDLDFDGVSVCDGDCDDGNAQNFPGNAEVCDDADNDCDGGIDEHATNFDGDPADSCDGDCNDTNPNVYPGAPELCDGLDNDCNFQVPANEYDLDGDGSRPCAGDCDDGNPVMSPSYPEVCDAYDNDCDGIVNDPWDPTEIGESSATAYGEGLELAGFNHIIHLPWAPCPGLTCNVFGGAVTLCRNNLSVSGAFASQADAFDSYILDYDQLATTLGCSMTMSLSGIPPGHDYGLRLYRTSNVNSPVSSWGLLQSSDNPGNASEYLTQPATNFLDFSTDTFVVVVLSKGNWNCPTAGSYTLNITGG
jgi:hypothetical protein